MTNADMLALADRIEKATPERQREMLREAGDLVWGERLPDNDMDDEPQYSVDNIAPNHWRFEHWLSVEAYESAAMLLLPEDDHDLSFERSMRGGEGFKLWQARYSLDSIADDPDATGPMVLGEAETAGLGIAAAALRARAQLLNGGNND